MSFNDVPKLIDVKISIQQGRNLGKNEIKRFFGVEYKRYYKKQQTTQTPAPNTTIKK